MKRTIQLQIGDDARPLGTITTSKEHARALHSNTIRLGSQPRIGLRSIRHYR